MKKFIIDTFSSLNNQYLIRNYIFAGFLYFPLVYETFFNMQSVSNSLIMFIFITLSYILYPFAIFVYDSVVETLMGNNVFIVNIVLKAFWVFIKVILIYMCSILIAPLGIGYLYFLRNKKQ